MIRRACTTRLAIGVALSVACAMRAAAQGASRWTIDPVPLTSIGSTDGNLDQELDAVLDARRLPDGRVVVVNGKPLELRAYSARGALITRIGRSGNGPGEFRGSVTLGSVTDDSVVVYSSGNSGWSVFGTDGKLRREWTDPVAERPQAAFYRRAFAEPARAALTVCSRQLLDAMPLPAVPVIREVMADGTGRFWVHDLGAITPWTVADRTGRVLGSVTLPPAITPVEIGPGYLVAILRDENDVEHVVVHHVIAPQGSSSRSSVACNRPAPASIPRIPADRMSDMKATMRNAETGMEAYYSEHRSYATDAGNLRVDPPADTRLHVLRASGQGYWLAVFDTRTSFFCAVAVGEPVPPGWGDGEIHCGH